MNHTRRGARGRAEKRTSKRSLKRAVHRGFTLIEMIVVIVILGVLSATALPRFLGLSEHAERTVLDSHLSSLRSATRHIALSQRSGARLTDLSINGVTLVVNSQGQAVGYRDEDGVDQVENDKGCAGLFSAVVNADPELKLGTVRDFLLGATDLDYFVSTVSDADVNSLVSTQPSTDVFACHYYEAQNPVPNPEDPSDGTLLYTEFIYVPKTGFVGFTDVTEALILN